MTDEAKTLAQFKKANKLVRLSFKKNGPKSYQHGVGALLNALIEKDGSTQRELVAVLGCTRKMLKDIVKKAERRDLVTIADEVKDDRTYTVNITEEGRKLAEKRIKANDRAAAEILNCLSEEEIAQLNTITEKLIVSAKENGIKGKKKGYRYSCHSHSHGHGHSHGHHGKCCHSHKHGHGKKKSK